MPPPPTPNHRIPTCDEDALHERQGEAIRSVPLDSPTWVAWLSDPAHPSFAYAGRLGSFTARREEHDGRAYWYAYRKRAGTLRKAYLGKAEEVTRARLETAARTLSQPDDAAEGSPDGVASMAVRARSSLPAALTSFVGREREVAEVGALLRRTRLLTLTGAGGVGKTRLALEVASGVEADYADGIGLVELAALADATVVAQAVAAALGILEKASQPIMTTLLRALKTRRLLLVLDNCEHVLDACARLATAVLRACPRVRLLVTSRETLGIAGETAWRVPSLSVPPEQDSSSPEQLLQYEAVRLFVERAGAVRVDFTLTPQTAAGVAQVCRRLDGIPLAIELATARMRVLSIEQIAARLDDRFALLTGGGRTDLARHQTLRATMDWSHDLLTEPEQVALRRLAVFAGGWTLEAAEAVISDPSPTANTVPNGRDAHATGDRRLAADQVLDLLTRLVDKSLVQVEERLGAARYRLLETVRQYAWEKLSEAGETAASQRRHADWCLALAEEVEPALRGPEQAAGLDQLQIEHDNLRAALAWCLEHDPPVGLRLAECLWAFWRMRGAHTQGRGWLERLLARAPAATATRVSALLAAAFLARMQGDQAATRVWAEEALALGRALGDSMLVARSLTEVGTIGFYRGDYRAARAWLAEALPLWRASGAEHGLALCLYRLGQVAGTTGDYAAARELLGESAARCRAAGNLDLANRPVRDLSWMVLCQGEPELAWALAAEALTIGEQARRPVATAIARERLGRVACWRGDLADAAQWFEASLGGARAVAFQSGIGAALLGLGQVAWRRGDTAGARAWLTEGLAVYRAMAEPLGSSAALYGLGRMAWSQGDATGATAWLRESLTVRRELGERLGIAECLEGLAAVIAEGHAPGPESDTAASELGTPNSELVRAARWLGAAGALRQTIGAPLPLVDRPAHAATLTAVQAALGDAAFATAWAAGRAMMVEQAMAEALADLDLAPAPDQASTTVPPAVGGLTGREVEVLRQLAAGRSNRQIAVDLSVSVRTVERHIANLYGKIDAANRAEAAAYAVRRGLA